MPRDRRTVGEAAADTDALPRGVLLDVKGPNTGQDLAPGFQSRAQRSAVLPPVCELSPPDRSRFWL